MNAAEEAPKLPWTVGTSDGFNASNIYDAHGNGIAQVFGVPMHTRLDDVDPARWEGLAKAKQIVRAVNCHEEMVAALQQIAWKRKAGATPKMVPGALLEEIEQIALAAIAKATQPTA